MIQPLSQHTPARARLSVRLAATSVLSPVFARLGYDTYDVLQRGIPVGAVYVPKHTGGLSIYSEYWVLFPEYEYPGAGNSLTTEIKSAAGYHYHSAEDFFAHVPFGAGYRFVNVSAHGGTLLPGRAESRAGFRPAA